MSGTHGKFQAYMEQTFEVSVGLSRAEILELLDRREDVHFGGSMPPVFRSPDSRAEFLVWTKRRYIFIRRAFGGPTYVLNLNEGREHMVVRGYFRGLIPAHAYGSGWGPIELLGRRALIDEEDRAHAKALVAFVGSVLLPHQVGDRNSPFRASSGGE